MPGILKNPWMIPLVMLLILGMAFFTSRQTGIDKTGRPIVVYAHPPCGPELMKLYRPIWEEFRRTHPDIDFRVLHITGEYEDKIKVMFAGNVAPDVIFMYPHALPAWVDMNALESLDEYLAKSEKVSRDDYFPAMLETFTYNGKLYGLPKDASATLMFYNVDMLLVQFLPILQPPSNRLLRQMRYHTTSISEGLHELRSYLVQPLVITLALFVH